ncbi:PEP-CTERM sorting domain-containing protein [Sabulicella rubraurantiaca]|uniref:PEP-CTERM sorting domain-containing protein n=1 Tax=Sabulicella rubraurantiaca TaxID=2811429 RepID=UPI001A976B16|nr:PEP-CTERM sorting domain-containing protein [Sabulicella rubraurantiaca]
MRVSAAVLAGGLLAACGATVSNSAKADWIFSFTQTSSWFGPSYNPEYGSPPPGSPPWPLPEFLQTDGFFRLADNVVRSRYTISAGNFAVPPYDAVGTTKGLVDMAFTTFYGPDQFSSAIAIDAQLSDWTNNTRPPDLEGYYGLKLVGTPGKPIPTGEIYFNNTESDGRLTIAADGSVIGAFNTDRGGTCGWGGVCGFSGYFTATHVPNGRGLGIMALQAAVPVPAPASMALLGLGLAGMILLRPGRRKAGSQKEHSAS